MRIGIFTDAYTPFVNGVTTSVLMLKKGLENKGHKVYVITVNPNNMHFSLDSTGTILRIPGIPIGIYDYRLSRIYPVPMINKMRNWKLDVIHSHTEFGIGILARLFAKQFNIPLVHTYHTLYEDYVYYVTHGYFDNLGKKIAIKMTKYFCDKKCDELIVPTPKIKELFINKYNINRNINVIPTGIDTEIFEINEKRGDCAT